MLLVIGNKNLSSWSMRPWLVLKHAGIPFEERVLPFETDGWRDAIGALSPSKRVPALHVGDEMPAGVGSGAGDGDSGGGGADLVIWDSLAICEYLAERFPDAALWPISRAARARARAVSAEMHSGFASMRKEMPMDVVARHPRRTMSHETENDVRRVLAIWTECLAAAAASGGGRFLFGDFSVADAMFAPVIWRFRTCDVPIEAGRARDYYDMMLALPAMKEWEADAAAEVDAHRSAAAAAQADGARRVPPHPGSAQHHYAVIFTSQRTARMAEEYAAAAQAMEELAAKQPGYLGIESARNADGFGITVSYWESLEAIRAWKDVPAHAAVQAGGKKSFYERYEVRVALVERGYKLPSRARAPF